MAVRADRSSRRGSTRPDEEEIAFIAMKAIEIRARVNTPLSSILVNAEMLLERTDLHPDQRRKIASMRDSGLEIRALLKQLDRTHRKTRQFLSHQKRRS